MSALLEQKSLSQEVLPWLVLLSFWCVLFALFLQDTWQVRDDFELTLGLRYERYLQDDEPAFSADVVTQYGINSSANLDGLDLIMPRVGFRWDAGDSTTVTGGFGLFAGGDPKVWTSNAFQPLTVFERDTFSNVDPTTVPAVLQANVAAGSGGAGGADHLPEALVHCQAGG